MLGLDKQRLLRRHAEQQELYDDLGDVDWDQCGGVRPGVSVRVGSSALTHSRQTLVLLEPAPSPFLDRVQRYYDIPRALPRHTKLSARCMSLLSQAAPPVGVNDEPPPVLRHIGNSVARSGESGFYEESPFLDMPKKRHTQRGAGSRDSRGSSGDSKGSSGDSDPPEPSYASQPVGPRSPRRKNSVVAPHTPRRHHRNPSDAQPQLVPQLRAVRTPLPAKTHGLLVLVTPAQRAEKRHGGHNLSDYYEFLSLLGLGALAHVYKARNVQTGRHVAIKQIPLPDTQEETNALMSEINLLKILNHPHIVKYHGFVKTSLTLNIVLEYCSGGLLRQLYLSSGRGLPEPQLVGYIRQILEGLRYLHLQGVVHRDVKAANVLLTGDGSVKLADFGVAAHVTAQHRLVVGTPNWMAPESVVGVAGLCTASDIWSLGATIIELVTTHPPYHDLNPMAALHAIGSDDHPPFPAGISGPLQDFLFECFQKQPGLRALARMLLRHPWVSGGAVAQETAVGTMRPPVRRSKTTSAQLPRGGVRSASGPAPARPERIPLGPHKPPPAVVDLQTFQEGAADESFEEFDHDASIDDKAAGGRLAGAPAATSSPRIAPSTASILEAFAEDNDDWDLSGIDSSTLQLPRASTHGPPFVGPRTLLLPHEPSDDSDLDPFLDMEMEGNTTAPPVSGEAWHHQEMQSAVEELLQAVSELHHLTDALLVRLSRACRAIDSLLAQQPETHATFVRHHGVLPMLEVLELARRLPELAELWEAGLRVVNTVFAHNQQALENFCMVGGIPAATMFAELRFPRAVRQQAVRFIGHVARSSDPLPLAMFVLCGGLRVVARGIGEDVDSFPELSFGCVDLLVAVFQRRLPTPGTDLCRLVARYGIVDWLGLLLVECSRRDELQFGKYLPRLLQLLLRFGRADSRAREGVATTTLFRLLCKAYPRLPLELRLQALKFLRAMLVDGKLGDTMYDAGVLDLMVRELVAHPPGAVQSKEVSNQVCPTVYNLCCYHPAREMELVKLGAVPLLQKLSVINLPFRQFVLPVLCELVLGDQFVREVLWQHRVFDGYASLLVDAYWQSTALDAVCKWLAREPERVELAIVSKLPLFVNGLLLTSPLNEEGVLEGFLQLVQASPLIATRLFQPLVVTSLLRRLCMHPSRRHTAVQMGLLRVLHALVVRQVQVGGDALSLVQPVVQANLNRFMGLVGLSGSLLVAELAREVLLLMDGVLESGGYGLDLLRLNHHDYRHS